MADDSLEVPPDEDLDDLGEPVDELRTLSESPSDGFLARVRSSLRRRGLASQLASLGWSGLGAVFVEFLRMTYALFQDKPNNRGGPS